MELGKLTEEQRQLAIVMLQEEVESFAKDNEDVGSKKGLQINLTSSDPTPVQKTSVPHPLYTEAKHYIHLIPKWRRHRMVWVELHENEALRATEHNMIWRPFQTSLCRVLCF